MSNMKNILTIQDLTIGYQSKKEKQIVAHNIDTNINAGDFVCILGKNGIGKSTLLRTIAQVQPSLAGAIKLKEKELQSFSSVQLAKEISLVLTESLPESNLSVYELIALGRQPYTNWSGALKKSDKKIIDEVVQLTQLEDLLYKKHFQLSDGQLQRVLIARALAQETPLIILDEPTAHLDVVNSLQTFKLLKELSEKLQKTIIVSTHQIDLALQFSSELWLMNDNGFTSGNTQSLIDSGALDTLFDKDAITFNKEQLRFIFQK